MSADLLLDTHALLWLVLDDPRAYPLLGDVLDDDASTVSVSAATYMEIAIKQSIGKLDVGPASVRRRARQAGLLELDVTSDHAESLGQLPFHHRDPFDRILIAQAMAEEMAIATADRRFAAYDGLRIHGQ